MIIAFGNQSEKEEKEHEVMHKQLPGPVAKSINLRKQAQYELQVVTHVVAAGKLLVVESKIYLFCSQMKACSKNEELKGYRNRNHTSTS